MMIFRLLSALTLVLTIWIVAPASQVEAANKPNILFIFADDQCYETVGRYGMTDIKTPALDRLCDEGTTFTRAYNMGSWSGAVCVASRTMLNTGRFIWRANAVYRDTEKERVAGRFWSEYMKQAGYETYMTGKWHVRAKAELAFDHAKDVRGGMPRDTREGYNRPKADGSDPWSPYDPKFGGFWAGGKHWSEVVGDNAVEFLNHSKQNDKPFFMYIAFNAPHDPRQAPKSYVDMYPLDKVKVPVNYLDVYPYHKQIGCGPNLRDEKLGPFPRTHHAVKVHRQEYYAIITHMDAQIARVIDHLKKTGQDKNTYIFFSADHGLGVGHHGLFGKQNLYDHSTRVPFMVVGPDVPKGKKTDEPVYLQDIMATSLDLAGVKKPKHVEFHNILPLAKGEKKSPYPSIYGAYLGFQRSVILDDYKLILYPQVPIARLYNLKDDPNEMKDLAKSAKHQGTMKRLFKELLSLQKQMDDKLDLKAKFPQLQ